MIDVALGAFTLRARMAPSEAYAATSFVEGVRGADVGGFALSAFAHAACFAALALFLPALGATDDEEISRDQMLTMRHLLDASAEHEQEAMNEQGAKAADEPEDHGASGGGRALGKAGTMGTEHAPKTAGHWSAAGDSPKELQQLSHEEKQALVKDFGMLGILATMSPIPTRRPSPGARSSTAPTERVTSAASSAPIPPTPGVSAGSPSAGPIKGATATTWASASTASGRSPRRSISALVRTIPGAGGTAAAASRAV